jgi:NADH-quinone oxidoreductase subunit M
MPWFAAVFLMITLSSIAVPGFNGFVGEFLILLGSFGRTLTGGWSTALVCAAVSGVILAAAYMLWMVQRVFYGEVTDPHNASLPDLDLREGVVLAPLVVLALVMGVLSPYFTSRIEPAVASLVLNVQGRQSRSPVAADAGVSPERGR